MLAVDPNLLLKVAAAKATQEAASAENPSLNDARPSLPAAHLPNEHEIAAQARLMPMLHAVVGAPNPAAAQPFSLAMFLLLMARHPS